MTIETTEKDNGAADDVRAALEELSAVDEGTTSEPTKDTTPRDESGRFAAKEPETKEPEAKKAPETKAPEVKAPADQQKPAEPTSEQPDAQNPEQKEQLLTQDKAPIGWGVKARERWSEIPSDLRQEILRREEASAQGVRQLHEQFAPARQFVESLSPFIREAIDNKVNPSEYVGRVLESERRLRVGTNDERFSALVDIAESYGIPLRNIINEAVGREVVPQSQKAQIPAEIQRELEEGRRFRQQYEQERRAQPQAEHPEITKFRTAQGHEYFEDVREDMAYLMESGVAKDMESAYKEACWRHPEIRSIMLEREQANNGLKVKQQNALGVKRQSSNAAETRDSNEFTDEDSTADTIRKAMAQQMGRI